MTTPDGEKITVGEGMTPWQVAKEVVRREYELDIPAKTATPTPDPVDVLEFQRKLETMSSDEIDAFFAEAEKESKPATPREKLELEAWRRKFNSVCYNYKHPKLGFIARGQNKTIKAKAQVDYLLEHGEEIPAELKPYLPKPKVEGPQQKSA